MMTFKQFIGEQSFNDDDWYLVDRESKKVIKHLGKPQGRDPKRYMTDADKQDVITGMRAKHQGYKLNEGNDRNPAEVGNTGTTMKGPRQCVIPGQRAGVTIISKRGERLKVRDDCGFTWMIDVQDFNGDLKK
jgi:hypothetical protein